MKSTNRSDRRGSAIVLVLFSVVILSLLGTGLLSLGMKSRVSAIRSCDDISARCAADAGVTKALFEMNEKLKVKPWSGSTLPQGTDEVLLNCPATYSYQVNTGSGNYTVNSTGASSQGQRSIQATLRVASVFEYALLTKGPLILKANTLIDGYNSSDSGITDVSLKVATTSTSSDQVVLNNGVTVDGDVFVGFRGEPSVVIKDLGASTGYRGAMTEEIVLPQVTPPGLAKKGQIKIKGSTTTITPVESGEYSLIELKRSNNPGVLEIDGGEVTLYVDGDIDMGQDCEIVIKDGSSLIVYLSGDLDADNNSGFNNQTQIPGNFKLYGVGDGDEEIILKAKSDVFGAIYAPDADVIVMADGDIYGSIVAETFEFKSGGDFYYDEALKEVTEDDVGVRFTVERWSE